MDTHRVNIKEKSLSRLDTCLKGLMSYFGHMPVRNITSHQCEAWLALTNGFDETTGEQLLLLTHSRCRQCEV